MNENPGSMDNSSRPGTVWGILTVIFGIFAMAAPLISGIAVTMLVAFALIA